MRSDEGDRAVVWFQRLESGVIAALSFVGFVNLGFAWWWLPALFLAFDLSMIGYVANPRLGAWTYNAVHSYVGPALVGVLAVLGDLRWAAFLALVWAFHIAVDRLLGYGLKFHDRFTHTHLGEIGPRRTPSTETPSDRAAGSCPHMRGISRVWCLRLVVCCGHAVIVVSAAGLV